MVWIINDAAKKVQQVGLGSPEMLAARNVYQGQEEAQKAHQAECAAVGHPTRLGNSKTRQVVCADCGTYLGLA